MWFIDKLKQLIYPTKCAFCGEMIAEGSCLCDECLTIYEREKSSRCHKCGKQHRDCLCPIHMSGNYINNILHISGYEKGSVTQALILHIKDDPSEDIIGFFGDELYSLVSLRDDFADAVITYIPRRKNMIKETGCDQARDLAFALGERSGKLPIAALSRKGNKAQKLLNGEDRRKNVRKSYFLADECREQIQGKTVYLIDDIITTGSTVSYCAELLIEGGARSVNALSIARRT